MNGKRFEPAGRIKRIWGNFLTAVAAGAGIMGTIFLKAPRLWWLAFLSGVATGFSTFLPLAYCQSADLQSVEITPQRVTVESKKQRRSLFWDEIAKAYFRSYEGTRWVFVSSGKTDLVFMVEGFTPQEDEAINSLIKMPLEGNKVAILK